MNNDLISRSALLRKCEAEDNDFDYCPSCGAKMDGRTDDENHHL